VGVTIGHHNKTLILSSSFIDYGFLTYNICKGRGCRVGFSVSC